MSSGSSSSSLNKIERAHQMYRDGQHEEALRFYTEALAMAKSKAQKIALHSNRAACFLKLHDFKKAAEECTLVLELDQKHTGALMLRAQTLVTLKEYNSALFDVNRLRELNPSSDVYHNLQARLKTQLSLAPIPESEEESLMVEKEEDDDDDEEEEEAEEEEKQVVEGAEIDQKPLATRIVTNPGVPSTQIQSLKDFDDPHSKGWEAIPKPKGHSNLDYSRWDTVEDDSSDDEENEDEEESEPQYRFRKMGHDSLSCKQQTVQQPYAFYRKKGAKSSCLRWSSLRYRKASSMEDSGSTTLLSEEVGSILYRYCRPSTAGLMSSPPTYDG